MAAASAAQGGNSRAQRYKKVRKGPQFELMIWASLTVDSSQNRPISTSNTSLTTSVTTLNAPIMLTVRTAVTDRTINSENAALVAAFQLS